jgi:hypothetical protein
MDGTFCPDQWHIANPPLRGLAGGCALGDEMIGSGSGFVCCRDRGATVPYRKASTSAAKSRKGEQKHFIRRKNLPASGSVGWHREIFRAVPRTGDQRWSPVSPSPAVEARIPQQVPPLRRVTLASPTAPTAAPANDNRPDSGGNRRRDYPPDCPRQKLLIPVRSAELSTTDSCGAPGPHGSVARLGDPPPTLTALVTIEVRFRAFTPGGDLATCAIYARTDPEDHSPTILHHQNSS